MNDPSKIGERKKFLQKNSISVIALVETKIKRGNVNKVQGKLSPVRRWEVNYTHSSGGRI